MRGVRLRRETAMRDAKKRERRSGNCPDGSSRSLIDTEHAELTKHTEGLRALCVLGALRVEQPVVPASAHPVSQSRGASRRHPASLVPDAAYPSTMRD